MIGRNVSHYRIEEQLGRGAMGVVYRAVDTRLDRDVALKFLPQHGATQTDAKKRFVQEAKAASQLDHPNIATVFEIGEMDEGRLFIVMPFYDGETLRERMARGRPSIEDTIRWALQIAKGLEAAHTVGIIHRDLKPANVMWAEGRARIVDFGVAKVPDVDLTATGSTLGTAAYMSPEQARREEVDARSDLWSLGVIMYEMLAGERPFEGTYPEAVVYAILHEPHKPLVEASSRVPESIASLVEGLLQKEPDDRPESAAEVVRRLQASEVGSGFNGEDGSPAVALDRDSPHPPGRQKAWAAVLGVFAALLIGAGAFVYFGFGSASEQANPAGTGGEATVAGHSVAVAPFEVSGAGSETWRDGMVSIMSSGLDGAAGLRAIPDRTIFASLRRIDTAGSEIDADPALATARRLDADYAVAGSAVVLGSELRLTADVHVAESGRQLGRAQAAGLPENVMSLADELTRQVLDILLQRSDAAVPSADVASLTTESLPALKQYLAGERHYRAGEYESAVQKYEAAIERDSSFARAYMRLTFALEWAGRASQEDSRQLLGRALKLSDQLSIRERRLLRAHRAHHINRYVPMVDSLREWTRLYPDDAEMWAHLGEVYFHGSVPGGWPEAEAAFLEAEALDSRVSPYHHHLMDLAFSLHRDSALAARRIAAHPEGPMKDVYRKIWDLVFRVQEPRGPVEKFLDTLALGTVPNYVFWWPLRHPSDRGLQEDLIHAVRGGTDRRTDLWTQQWAIVQLERGHVAEASKIIADARPSSYTQSCLPVQFETLGYTIPDSLAHLASTTTGTVETAPHELQCKGFFLIERGRYEEARSVIDRIRALPAGERSPLTDHEIEIAHRSVEGYMAWKNGNLRQAATLWSGFNNSFPIGAVRRGDLYRRLGIFKRPRSGTWRLGRCRLPTNVWGSYTMKWKDMGRPPPHTSGSSTHGKMPTRSCRTE